MLNLINFIINIATRRSHYFNVPDEKHLIIRDLIGDINLYTNTPDLFNQHDESLKNIGHEIEITKMLWETVSRISPLLDLAEINSLSDIDDFFTMHKCSYLLEMKQIINFQQMINP